MKQGLAFLILTLIASPIAADPSAAKPLQVGAILPLTGTVAPWGERVRVGLETANELQGKKFAFRYEDEGPCEAQKALTAYRKLVNLDGAKIIFLGCLAGTEAIAPVAASESVLLLSLGLLNESTLASGAKLIDLATEIGTESEYLAKYVASDESRNIAGLFFADAFGQEFSRVLSRNLKSHGQSFVALDEAGAQIQTFSPLILRWKRLNVDLLITSLSDQQQVILLKEMHTLKFKPTIYSTYVLESFAPSAVDRKFFEGVKYTHPINHAENWEATRALERELAKREKAGQGSNINALFAYDGLGFLKSALAGCNGVDPACLYDYFTALGAQEGVSGRMRFRKTGALSRPCGLKTVKNGEFVWINRREL